MQSSSGVKNPSIPFGCRRSVVDSLPPLFRRIAAVLIDRGEFVLISDEVKA